MGKTAGIQLTVFDTNGTALSLFSRENRGIRIRSVFVPIDALVRSEQDIKHFWEAMSQGSYLDWEPRLSGPGRPKTYDGNVTDSDLSRFERVEADDADIALYHQVVNHPHLKRNLRLVVVQHLPTGRYALLFSTDVARSAPAVYRYDKARFQIALLFRDAKQFTGLSDCQARSANKLCCHCNASLSAVRFAKLEA